MSIKYKIVNFFSSVLFISFISSPTFASGHTFTSFNTGVITGAGSVYSNSLNTASLIDNYLLFIVTADFVGGATPAFSNTINMEIDNNATKIFSAFSQASDGKLNNSNSTTLIWTGIFSEIYIGGNDLRIKFKDTFTNASGPYTSQLNNVKVTIYRAPIPEIVFSSFNTTEITGGGSTFNQILPTSGLNGSYLMYQVKADFVGGSSPAFSSTMNMEFDNNGAKIFKSFSSATAGKMNNSDPTTLIWSGILNDIYTGGTDLRIKFKDTFTDGSGPYTSQLNNAVVTFYHAPPPNKMFAQFNTGEITGAGSEYSNTLDITGLTGEYLIYIVTADFVGGSIPAFSSTMNMEFDNNGTKIYKLYSSATDGKLNNSNPTKLIWSGIFNNIYSGGTNLRIKFKDTFSNGSGPYTSQLNNVNVALYSVPAPSDRVSLKMFLEGAYNTSTNMMNLDLGSEIPKTSPYSADIKTVISVPPNVVDWVLLELRDKDVNTQIVESRSAFLLESGNIVDIDGSNEVQFLSNEGQYYVVIKHRNHLPIMSSGLVDL